MCILFRSCCSLSWVVEISIFFWIWISFLPNWRSRNNRSIFLLLAAIKLLQSILVPLLFLYFKRQQAAIVSYFESNYHFSQVFTWMLEIYIKFGFICNKICFIYFTLNWNKPKNGKLYLTLKLIQFILYNCFSKYYFIYLVKLVFSSGCANGSALSLNVWTFLF